LVLAAAVAATALLTATVRPATVRPGTMGPVPVVTPANAHAGADGLVVSASRGGALWTADGVRGRLEPRPPGPVEVLPRADHRHSAALITVPSAVQWRPPAPGLPSAHVLSMTEVDEVGRAGPLRMHTTLFTDHGELPVVSVLMDDGALLDPDTGLHVVGHAVMAPTDLMRDMYQGDGRWWKYPGNYMFRGRAWERSALVQVIAPDGSEVVQAPTGVRIHGNVTRGFPQKAFRLVLREPLPVDLFGDGTGTEVVLLRSAGNDQPKAFMRDPLLQGLCDGLPLEVARSRPCVVYVNGAYWGLSYMQQRIDEEEIARRHGLSKRDVAMVEVAYDDLLGPRAEAKRFRELTALVKAWDGRGTEVPERVRAQVDVEGFMAYMAALLMAGNQDWPYHNVKVWRYTGERGAGRPREGRWNFILGDTDLALGAHAAPGQDLLAVAERNARWPVAAMFLGMMRSPELKAIFVDQVRALHQDRLAQGNMLAALAALEARLAPEMPRHTARWRKPASPAEWAAHVAGVRRYITARDRTVARWLEAQAP
jgi:hypothetical protein